MKTGRVTSMQIQHIESFLLLDCILAIYSITYFLNRSILYKLYSLCHCNAIYWQEHRKSYIHDRQISSKCSWAPIVFVSLSGYSISTFPMTNKHTHTAPRHAHYTSLKWWIFLLFFYYSVVTRTSMFILSREH